MRISCKWLTRLPAVRSQALAPHPPQKMSKIIRASSLAFLLLSGGATLIWILSGKSFVYLSLILKQLRERGRDDNFYITKLFNQQIELTSSNCNQKYPKTIFKMSPIALNHPQNVAKSIRKPSSKCHPKYAKTNFSMSTDVSQGNFQNVTKSMPYP